MDRSKVHTLRECLDTIESMEKVCIDKFKPHVCKNLRSYYLQYCYRTFDKEKDMEKEMNFSNSLRKKTGDTFVYK